MLKSSGVGLGMSRVLTLTVMGALIAGGVWMPTVSKQAHAETLYDIMQRRKATARAPAGAGRQLNPHFVPPHHATRARPPSQLHQPPTQNTYGTSQQVKTVVIARPKIYDYKPEKLVTIDFSSLDFQKTASIGDMTDPGNEALKDGGNPYWAHVAGIRTEKQIADVLRAHYVANPTLLWSEQGAITQKATKVMELLARADEEGLFPQDYQVMLPDDALSEEEHQQKLAHFDVMLSARALRYAMDVHGGRIVADKLSAYHDLPRLELDLANLMHELGTSSQPAALLEKQAPQSDWYVALKLALAEIRDTRHEAEIPLAANMVLRPGQNHEALPQLINLIKKRGSADYLAQYAELLDQYQDKTTYDKELKPAIIAFQKSVGKAGDGVVGPATISALQGVSNQLKEQRLIMAMERLRWLPRDFSDRYVFINQPAYQAQYFENGTEKLVMRTVVGSPNNQTYFFYDKISLVTFNPSWGVPRSIIFNEMMPKILNDPSYLTRNGYEVYSASGKVLDPYSVDWPTVASKGHGVNIRQKPGKRNALGELKILFPNKHDIYLHDTPSKKLFDRDARALSHGCVRLANPRQMAAAVMGVEVEDLKRYFGTQERNVQVTEKVPVFLTYFTAWPDAKTGLVRYYQDIYGRDKALEKASQKTTQSRLDS